jgi:hypothetical protein
MALPLLRLLMQIVVYNVSGAAAIASPGGRYAPSALRNCKQQFNATSHKTAAQAAVFLVF